MIYEAQALYQRIQTEINDLPINEFMLTQDEVFTIRSHKTSEIIQKSIESAESALKTRILNELNHWGPLHELMEDESITEILVNGPQAIWFEKKGLLYKHKDFFFSDLSFRNCLERICQGAHTYITKESPCADGKFLDFRLSLVGGELTQGSPHLSLRRHPKIPWTFQKLKELKWCHEEQLQYLQSLLANRRNFLVVGATGTGKTTVLNAFLELLPQNERAIVIEDTSEITLPNSASLKLLTREDPQNILSTIDQTQLVKRSLRLRPDRIVMGEIRGHEAKDFLMALATGHDGSFGTLHAQDANQALIRLEMLIQMGAPHWSLQAIRRLIQLSLDHVIVIERTDSGVRKLKGIYRLCSLEDHGFLVEAVLPES